MWMNGGVEFLRFPFSLLLCYRCFSFFVVVLLPLVSFVPCCFVTFGFLFPCCFVTVGFPFSLLFCYLWFPVSLLFCYLWFPVSLLLLPLVSFFLVVLLPLVFLFPCCCAFFGFPLSLVPYFSGEKRISIVCPAVTHCLPRLPHAPPLSHARRSTPQHKILTGCA